MSTRNSSVEEPEETFHIYILSFSYGFLLLVIVGHLVVRWQWRRVTESKTPHCYPGDKSFKCKAIREELSADFSAIRRLAPDPLLINDNYDPKVYGSCRDGEAVPSHWYRLKTCEAASKFVSANRMLLRNAYHSPNPAIPVFIIPSQRHAMILALPEFVVKLRQEGVLYVVGREREAKVARLCELYVMARTQDGEFHENKFEEFMDCLQQLQGMLPVSVSRTLAAPLPTNLESSVRSALQKMDSSASEQGLLREFSLEPLLAASSSAKSPTATSQPPHHRTHATKAHTDQDLSPLITVELPSYRDSSYLMPETPL